MTPPNPPVPPDPGGAARAPSIPLSALSGAGEDRFDLEQVRQILPYLVDALSDAVVVVDDRQRVVAANRRYVEEFGVKSGWTLHGLCRDTLMCPESRSGEVCGDCAASRVLTDAQPVRRIRSLPDAAGVLRRWEATFNPVMSAGGHVTHVVQVWRDISERSKLESQLSHSERLASLGQLAAGVAHEVNNPLASVMAGVESLQRWLERGDFGDASRGEAAEVLEVLERAARRCRETTDKLMLLAQPYSAAAGWVDLNRAVLDTLSLLRFQMRKFEVSATEALDPSMPPIWAREGGIRGICMNLMMNAVQAMPAGGQLTIITRAEGESVVLQVEDDGPGIAPEHLDRIWDPFFTTKPVGQGTGLGLSITQRIVSRHGGTIRVESRSGAGARFIVRLPVQGPGGSGE
jgi:two-component system, NtrC family, sensor kinase